MECFITTVHGYKDGKKYKFELRIVAAHMTTALKLSKKYIENPTLTSTKFCTHVPTVNMVSCAGLSIENIHSVGHLDMVE